MPRKARDERLDTRTARTKLSPRREPYWRTIQEGRAIGYRRLAGGRAGTWIARHYEPSGERKYKALGADVAVLGECEDLLALAGEPARWPELQSIAYRDARGEAAGMTAMRVPRRLG